MSDNNDNKMHPSAQGKHTKPDVKNQPNRPPHPAYDQHDDDDFDDLEKRFSTHGKNRYYAKVSTGYRAVKLILVILLTAVIAFALVLGSDNFTYANLRYLLRNLGEANSAETERAAAIEFHGADGTDLAIFSGKLAVAGTDNVSLYRLSGKKLYELATDVSEPVITEGGKYFFVWKCGEPEISVYNNVSRVGTITADGPVYALSADNSGSFAVLYKDRVYSSAVAVYDSDLDKRATKNMPSENAVDIALSGDGRMLYTLSFSVGEGDYVAKLDFSDINGAAVTHTYTYSGEFPLKCGAFSDGGCYAVTDKSLCVYSSEGTLLYSEKTDDTPYRIIANDAYACIVTGGKGSGERFTVVSQSGAVAVSATVDGAVLDGCLTEDALFLLSSSIVSISLEDGNRQLIARSPNALSLLTDGAAVYCVYTGRAELVYADGKPFDAPND